MAGQATQWLARARILFPTGGMIHARMIGGFIAVASQASLLNIAPRESFGIASMGGVTGGAAPLHHGFMAGFGLFRLGAQGLMALQAEVFGVAV